MKLRLKCPAKVNLFLAVGPPDRRGYHPLRTIFQAVDLYDTLDVDMEREPGLEIVGAELPDDNTITKAVRLSQEIFARKLGHIRLEKRIPMQSGLGGGSSDAAGVLRALRHITPSFQPEVEGVAAAVGADVPFFLTGGRARGERYGDRVSPLPDTPEQWLVIVKPPIGCSTVEMYARLDGKAREWRDWPAGDELYNDFERVAPCECLDLIEALQKAGARDAALSGSGSSVFGRFASRDAAEDAADKVGRGNSVWAVRSLTRAESLRIEILE